MPVPAVSARLRSIHLASLFLPLLLAATLGCAGAARRAPAAGALAAAERRLTAAETAFLDTLERRTFRWFWDLSDARTGLTPDRAPTPSFASVAAMGFALTAYPIGADRGWVTRADAAGRTLVTLRFLWTSPAGDAPAGCTRYHGFYYHFLDRDTGTRFNREIELSTIDTGLMLAGALFCQTYFDRDDPAEREIRALAESLYVSAEWSWAVVRPPMICHGWDPEHGFLAYDWRGMNESMIVPILALGSPTHAVGVETWRDWERGCQWGEFEGLGHVGFPPLFGHQFPQVWLDLRDVQDSLMAAHGIDWFENSRRATLAQRAYALRDPGGFRGYGERLWGLSASDGPLDGTVTVDGRKREFHTYAARGASFREIIDDGTVAPYASGSSIAFAPEVVIPMLMALVEDHGAEVYGPYGFVDALNPTLRVTTPVPQGRVVPGRGWYDTDRLGIDQGPMLAMIENYRSELVWRTMRRNPHVIRGLKSAGFRGGWLERVK
jgi:hypothetical protein